MASRRHPASLSSRSHAFSVRKVSPACLPEPRLAGRSFPRRSLLVHAAASATLVTLSLVAAPTLHAQTPSAAPTTAGAYPSRPIRFIVPFAAGGVSDILGRSVALKMSEVVGQQWVVENRGGAGGTIGADVVANATPDGYTILLSSLTTQSIAPHMLKKLPYNTLTAFTPVGGVALSPNILSIGSSQPMKSVKDIIAAAKANPGKVIYGSSGQGSIGHLTGEILRAATGVDMTHVPFKSAALAYPDVMGGNITMVFDTLPSAMQHIKSGAVRPVAMLSPKRSPAMPDVPTIAEAGFPEATLNFWSALFGPANMPPAVVQRLNESLNKSLAAPDLRDRLVALGSDPWPTTPQELTTRVREDFERMGKVIKTAGIAPE
ncbi:MAG: tripartite tricarboxylate transporter substrate binding protein [Proteobacteria bacterium]|nr:tripartite tricarboxylate transporter substrate binding protein [Burkholderiales bacterium]